jgi:hypothetical protein
LIVAALLACAVAPSARGGSGPSSRCTYRSRRVAVAIADGRSASLRVGRGGRIELDGGPCGDATTAGATSIDVTGRDAELALDLRGGSFGRLAISAGLRGSHDAVRVVGSPRDEHVTASGTTIALPASEGGKVALRGVDRVVIDGSHGDDTLSADGSDLPVSLSGGAGDDTLVGGNRDDSLRGGDGEDGLRGGSGDDRLYGGDGRDSLSGGAGRDRISGAAGRDTCEGGADRDELASCGPAFRFDATKVDRDTRRRMTGRSWHHGCPVGIGDLRLVRVRFWDFDSDVHLGKLVVNRDAVTAARGAMRRIFAAHFPIRRMRPIDAYGGDDHRSMAADNTSAFNCREVAGRPGVWSQHAYGRAIDINPIENPYVTPSGYVSPPAGLPYADRSRHARGMIHHGDPVARAFLAVGWGWAGDWSGTRDYQHFSANGH